MHLYVSDKGEWWVVVRVDIYLSSLLTSGARWCGWSVPNPNHFTP